MGCGVWVVVTGAILLLGFLLLTWFGGWGARWGATADELSMALPGDEWLAGGPRVHLRMTRAVWIEAPAAQVWPWLAQAGRGAGWYSYDRLDNGGRASARHIVSWIPEPRLGDAGPIGYLRHLDPGRELAWWIGGGRFFGAHLRGVMYYGVTAEGTRARLVVRIQCDARGLLAQPACWLLRVIDTIMARRQMLGVKERAERYGVRNEDPLCAESGARDQFQLYHAIYASGEEVGVAGKEDAPRWRRAAIEDGLVPRSG
jgi:hypothetical protein